MKQVDVLVIGGGPAGLAAAIAAKKKGASVLLIEREARLGGIMKQCIHDGFGLIRFGERLSGPEYVERFMDEFYALGIEASLQTFVTEVLRTGPGFEITAVTRDGVAGLTARTIILATGCRERTARQVQIHGTRPAGIFTAGTAQHFVNLMGQMPTRRCVILGSGDIGLIMARRLTLEGAQVLGVYEVKPEPSGLTRNLVQCLEDYGIPLHLSHTVTRVLGPERVEGVVVARVDERQKPIPGTEETIACDALILSVGLIPENEMAERLGVALDPRTRGPVCDNRFMTSVDGVFCCGNALHVNDLVDYVSESGELAGQAAADYRPGAPVSGPEIGADASLGCLVPQRLRLDGAAEPVIFYFRSRKSLKRGTFVLRADGRPVFEKKLKNLKPPEMERLLIDFEKLGLEQDTRLTAAIEKGEA
ncbi:FAD-dependent oxidoreductase [Eubacterium sp. 1001713B170207_170306_E7]|uniref:NAD(P)/FAD-dependent oxidoreductase n=1 Tax=Eubacterium sp. 1001713B170207_170306_E7 TaxID=2787097 RepID=UPI00189B096B|nr:FAD-dependent oxidoreductase [Eubacterium sp. 1001713B170207_170306_E7]